jgi:protein-disulfide isomerase
MPIVRLRDCSDSIKEGEAITMSDVFERAVLSVLAVAGATIAIALAHREFSRPAAQPASVDMRPRFEKDWRTIARSGIPMSDTSPPIKVIEFADFECPFCRRFDSVVKAFDAIHPGATARLFVHFPLKMHKFANLAARAAECAGEQDRFVQMHDALFAKQDSFGLRPWLAYAKDAHIEDSSRFQDCISARNTPARIAAGLALGAHYRVQSTPTVIVNGWRFTHPPADSTLTRLIADLRSGKTPAF